MKKNVPRKELIEKAKAWLASFSNEELAKKLADEKHHLERDRAECLAWFTNTNTEIHVSLPEEVESSPKSIRDEREFRWSLNPIDEKHDIPARSTPQYEGFFLEAA